MENKFFRFLTHTIIVIAMFIICGVFGSQIELAKASGEGYVYANGLSIAALLVFPFFIILHLVFDVMSEWENVVLSFLRGALAFIGCIGIALGSIFTQLVAAMDFDGTLPSVFQAALVPCGAFAGFVALYLYIGSEMLDMQRKSFLIPPLSIVISFVVNLIFALLGYYIHPFFYTWLLLIIMGVGTIVVVICLFKFGIDDVTDRVYPSGFPSHKPTPTPSTSGKSNRQRVTEAVLEGLEHLSKYPDDHIKHDEYVLRIDAPMPFEFDVDKKEVFFNADMYMNTYDQDELRSSKFELQGIIESLIAECLSKGAEYDSYFDPSTWDIFASVMLYDADRF